MTSTLPPLVQAFSGAIGSAAANTTTYPLDLVTTRLQTTRSKRLRGIPGVIRLLAYIARKHGIGALYDGLGADSAATLLSNFFYFYFYSFLRGIFTRRKRLLSAPAEIGLGFIAGVASRAVSTPLSVIAIRLQTERDDDDDDEEEKEILPTQPKETGVLAVVRRIYAADGLAGFWRGFSTTVLLSLNPALTLSLFQLFRRVVLRGRDSARPTPGQAFVGAAVANSIAVFLLYPLILYKTRLQTAPSDSPPSIASVLSAGSGAYQGLEAQLLKGCLGQGVTMMVKQRVEESVVQAWLHRKTS